MNPPMSRYLWIMAVVLIFAAGISLRILPLASFKGVGFDEVLYKRYVTQTLEVGILNYPKVVEEYIKVQKGIKSAILPPLRFTYIAAASFWSWISGAKPLDALHHVSAFFSIFTLGVSFAFILRMAGRSASLAVLALMAFAPTQIHMSQHALIDGFFAFWALLLLWLLWENLQTPGHKGWLAAYTLTFAVLTATKENAAFVFIAILAVIIASRWFKFGTVTRPLVIATFAGPALGVLILILLAGNLESFFTTYLLLVNKAYALEYAIKTGDGPWFRYLIDLMLVSPVVLILAIGSIFQIRLDKPEHRAPLFVFTFVAASYLIMCNIKYGMNLRYTNMWDAPLRLLAFTQLTILADRLNPQRRNLFLVLSIVAICALELRQYWIFGIEGKNFYEMVTEIFLRSLKILK